MEHDPFITLQVDEFGMLPTAVDFTLAPGIVAHYTQPVRYTKDYAIMPEVLALDAVNQFCDELNEFRRAFGISPCAKGNWYFAAFDYVGNPCYPGFPPIAWGQGPLRIQFRTNFRERVTSKIETSAQG